MQAAMTTWAARDLPARLDVVATAKLLGFAESDIQVLMAVGKLTPLGDRPRGNFGIGLCQNHRFHASH